MKRSILSLCDASGVWSQPYVAAGYEVTRVDLVYKPGKKRIAENLWHVGCDLLKTDFSGKKFYAILAAPPCCCFCRPGARWWVRMDASGETARAVAVFRKCLEIAKQAKAWWALENPPGRHQRLIPELGRPNFQYQPWEYGDDWTKQTYIWGTAVKPPVPPSALRPLPLTYRTPNGHTQGRISRMSSSWKSAREQTPQGFARAFFLSNP